MHIVFRDDVTNLLTQQFSTEDPADGGEYARALDTQANAECFVVAIAALLADRRETMNAERTTLASHEYKDIAKRKTLRFEHHVLLSWDNLTNWQ
jgi:E3 ubiquitin-protein ligase SHPRH